MFYKSFEVKESEFGEFTSDIIKKEFRKLEIGEVAIKVEYSSLNYKDCLSISGNKGITRKYPHIPGIDLAGEVLESKANNFSVGEKVLCTGYDLGMNVAGGFAEVSVVPQDWLIKLPKNLSTKQVMQFGTAGFTASLATHYIKQHFLGELKDKNILITGAGGGVGLIANLLLQDKANIILASRDNGFPYESLLQENKKALLPRKYDAIIDSLGGVVLNNLLKETDYNGIVISCGNILGVELHNTIFPFILRGITLKGVSSANTAMNLRKEIWQEIAKFSLWQELQKSINEIPLEQIKEKSELILQGKHQGRFLIKI